MLNIVERETLSNIFKIYKNIFLKLFWGVAGAAYKVNTKKGRTLVKFLKFLIKVLLWFLNKKIKTFFKIGKLRDYPQHQC